MAMNGRDAGNGGNYGDDGDHGEDGDDGNESSSSDFMVIANNNASAKKISFATLCQNSQSDDSSDEDGNNTTYKEKNPVYVADSDSEWIYLKPRPCYRIFLN